ncbi:MAG: hypothetical protein MZV70_68480 [Desulfobacterales bacterium]|nr:hypothetical protein [Desulfobacterales bacterium]
MSAWGCTTSRSFTRQIDDTEALLQQLQDADLEHSTELKKLDAAVEEIKLERWQKNQAIGEQKNREVRASSAPSTAWRTTSSTCAARSSA